MSNNADLWDRSINERNKDYWLYVFHAFDVPSIENQYPLIIKKEANKKRNLKNVLYLQWCHYDDVSQSQAFSGCF